MAASPRWKIFNSKGEYQASVKDVGLAAMIVAFLGNGSTIRDGHGLKSIVWTEGAESQSAGESYDNVETVIHDRVNARWAKVRRIEEPANA